jgi:superfamily I DNA and/or RNA helicase
LDPTAPLFDLVLFDEASQIPTHDAIGALARARQAVVAGDDKQLPPTAFFDRQDDDDGDVAGENPRIWNRSLMNAAPRVFRCSGSTGITVPAMKA